MSEDPFVLERDSWRLSGGRARRRCVRPPEICNINSITNYSAYTRRKLSIHCASALTFPPDRGARALARKRTGCKIKKSSLRASNSHSLNRNRGERTRSLEAAFAFHVNPASLPADDAQNYQKNGSDGQSGAENLGLSLTVHILAREASYEARRDETSDGCEIDGAKL